MTITIISDNELTDCPFDIVIRQLKPLALYKIEMTLFNYYNINAPMTLDCDIPWKSYGYYYSDHQGSISVNQTICQEGSYQGQSNMGLFFNSRPQELKKVNKLGVWRTSHYIVILRY
ncbi:acyl-CoA thioesterase/BAAT N-terminal domain-containing protein [Streptococcus dentapri]|uniref:Acyl-CoA thioesterase/BAAT N-terminal domain-containing protein n=1 Tax=Streptococcus dentapri TaxID=573564 RepID=A0ABV8D0T0_9STRE